MKASDRYITRNMTKEQLVKVMDSMAVAMSDMYNAETKTDMINAYHVVRKEIPCDVREGAFGEEFDFDTM